MFTKVTHVPFQNVHFIYFVRYVALILLGFAPYFARICPFPYYGSLNYLQ